MNKREIKFRVWDIKKEKLLNDGQWDIIALTLDGYLIKVSTAEYSSSAYDYDDENKVIMQFTGLKDKKGKEIYEGDIVNGCSFLGSHAYGIVEYHNDQFLVVPIGRFIEGTSDITTWCEVIGNIYENTELL